MFGFASLSAVLFILCGIAMARSLDTYRSSALGVEKLQARAAAEGAAIAWAAGTLHANTPLQLGECTAQLSEETSTTSELRGQISVQVRPKSSKSAALQTRYVVMADVGTSGVARLRSLELIP
jgi:hypothetical protein